MYVKWKVKDFLLLFFFSGSILVPCAYHHAYVMGTDINYLLLHAKGMFWYSHILVAVNCLTVMHVGTHIIPL